jgi:transposase
MSNVLKVSLQTTIYSLADRGWSQRRIAQELGINRETVGRYLGKSKPAISTTGSLEAGQAKPAISTAGSLGTGRKSPCEALAESIKAKVQIGLSAQRIWQDLVQEHGFSNSYESVKRFVRKLRAAQPQAVCRLECQPGEELQLDFGLGAPIQQPDGKTRRSWVLRMVLSYSRKGYSEALYRQDTETFLRCLENGLRSFGGVPLLLKLDNFKAAVRHADWFDPDINPKLADFCRHYRIHVVPCRPGKPQHKGKVERGIGYVRSNALKGGRFKSLSEQNLFLSHWENQVADKRIHDTTRKQVAALFEQERSHLQPLPDTLFPSYQEARRNAIAIVTSKWFVPFTKCLPNTSAIKCGSGGTAAACAFLMTGSNRSRSTHESNQAALVTCWVQEASMHR